MLRKSYSQKHTKNKFYKIGSVAENCPKTKIFLSSSKNFNPLSINFCNMPNLEYLDTTDVGRKK